MHIFLCQNVWLFPNCILLAKKATHFILEVSAVYVISSFYVINCFKYFLIYILGQCLKKTDKKKFKLYQVFMCWIGLNILGQNVSKIRQETFWTISNPYVLNCFKYFLIYILGQMSQKNQTRKLYQVFMYNFLCQNG